MACHVQCMSVQWKVKNGLAHANAQIPLTLVYCTICAVAKLQKKLSSAGLPCPFTMAKVAVDD